MFKTKRQRNTWIVLHAVSDALGQVPVQALKQPRSRFLVQTMVQVDSK